MTIGQSYQLRTAMDVPWDNERERRVLGRALSALRRRARRKRALEVAAALTAILAVSRALPHAPRGDHEAGHVPAPAAVPAAELETCPERGPSVSLPNDAALRAKRGPSGGFAGTGGHGGGGSTGRGGSAGTG